MCSVVKKISTVPLAAIRETNKFEYADFLRLRKHSAAPGNVGTYWQFIASAPLRRSRSCRYALALRRHCFRFLLIWSDFLCL